jgi:hypothetical protein
VVADVALVGFDAERSLVLAGMFLQVAVAQLGDVGCHARLLHHASRIVAALNSGQKLPCFPTSLIGSQGTMSADCHSALLPARRPVLNEISAHAARQHAHTEAPQLDIPNE